MRKLSLKPECTRKREGFRKTKRKETKDSVRMRGKLKVTWSACLYKGKKKVLAGIRWKRVKKFDGIA